MVIFVKKKIKPKIKIIQHLPPSLCFLRSVRSVLSVHGFDFMRVLVVFSPVRYLSQVSDSSTLHPVQLFPDHGLGIVVSLLGDHGVIVSPVLLFGKGVAIMGVTAPSPSAPGASRPLPSLVLQGRLPLVPCHHPGPGSNGSRPGAIAMPPPWNRRPSAPTLMPLTGTAAPATGPGAGPGAWSGDRAAAVGPEHGAGHSFLWPPPAAALEPRWPVASPSPLL